MDWLEQAKTLYRKRQIHAQVISQEDQDCLTMSISKLIRSCLEHQAGEASFKYLPFISVIKRTVESNKFQGDRAALAFSNLQKLLLLLLAEPWKREFWQLKTYGGFFCTKIKAYLEYPEEILELVGYTKEESVDQSVLMLHSAPNPEVALNVAFDCEVASVECLYIGEYYDKMKNVGMSLADAVKVVLSGADQSVPSGTAALPFKGSAIGPGLGGNLSGWNNNSVARISHSPVLPQTYVAVSEMGMGIVVDSSNTSAAMMAQQMSNTGRLPYTLLQGVRPQVGLGHGPMPAESVAQPLSSVPEHVGLKVDLPHHPVYPGGRPMFFAGQPAGPRSSYGSSAYGSGSGSVMGVPSSAYTGSSGYSSGAHSQVSSAAVYNSYGLPQDTVNTATMPAQAGSAVGRQHTKYMPIPQQASANFPYIDEDDRSTGASFPEGTHEEHLQESLKNLQIGQTQSLEQSQSKTSAMSGSAKSSTEGLPSQAVQLGINVPVSYDDWRWFSKNQGTDVRANINAATTSTTVVQRPMHFVSSDGNSRASNVQPAMAVTALLTPNFSSPSVDGNRRQMASLDSRQPRSTTGEYVVPMNVMSGGAGPLGMASTPDQIVVNFGGVSSDKGLNDWKVVNVKQPQSQPVYYPPGGREPYFFNLPSSSGTSAMRAVPQQVPSPTFTQVASAGRPSEHSTLLSRQAMSAVPADISNLHVVRGGQERSSSEVVMREKVLKISNQRASSLTGSSSKQMSPQGLVRQSSRSMDLGSLKWKCRYCTMENSAVEKICLACSRSRDAPDPQFPNAGESKRQCPTCTFENPPNNVSCDICMCILPKDVHTYV